MKVTLTKPQAQKDLLAVKSDQGIEQLANMTPAQAADYIEQNVTNLTTAKVELKRMAKIIAWLVRRELKKV